MPKLDMLEMKENLQLFHSMRSELGHPRHNSIPITGNTCPRKGIAENQLIQAIEKVSLIP